MPQDEFPGSIPGRAVGNIQVICVPSVRMQ